jgi:predicted nucleic acid-binding protein
LRNKLLIDTDVLIDFSRGFEIASNRLNEERLRFELSISSITYLELINGCQNKRDLRFTESYLSEFKIIHLNPLISLKSIELIKRYNLSHNLQIPDCLIAATSLIERIPLLSKNQRDFRFVEEIELLPYP